MQVIKKVKVTWGWFDQYFSATDWWNPQFFFFFFIYCTWLYNFYQNTIDKFINLFQWQTDEINDWLKKTRDFSLHLTEGIKTFFAAINCKNSFFFFSKWLPMIFIGKRLTNFVIYFNDWLMKSVFLLTVSDCLKLWFFINERLTLFDIFQGLLAKSAIFYWTNWNNLQFFYTIDWWNVRFLNTSEYWNLWFLSTTDRQILWYTTTNWWNQWVFNAN